MSDLIITLNGEIAALEAEVKTKNKEVERLSADLSANATMLARQCDMAREAERKKLVTQRDLSLEIANHAATQRSLYACNGTVMEQDKQIDVLTAENGRLRERLKVAEDVVSYLVIWGALPTDKLAELVEKSMSLRMRDKETLCIPSAVKDALKAAKDE
jgi:ribosomal protein S16